MSKQTEFKNGSLKRTEQDNCVNSKEYTHDEQNREDKWQEFCIYLHYDSYELLDLKNRA